jgi:uncharacterized protein (TIGR03067 family)
MKGHALILVAAALQIAADNPRKDVVQTELKKLEGTWVVVKAELEGKPFAFMKGTRYVFAGNKATLKGKKRDKEATFTLAPTRDPKEIDFTPARPKEPVSRAIYRLEGDKLTLCFPAPTLGAKEAGKRPTSFSNKGLLLILQRQKS